MYNVYATTGIKMVMYQDKASVIIEVYDDEGELVVKHCGKIVIPEETPSFYKNLWTYCNDSVVILVYQKSSNLVCKITRHDQVIHTTISEIDLYELTLGVADRISDAEERADFIKRAIEAAKAIANEEG